MLDYSNEDIEKIKHLISEGANQEAINALRPIVEGNNELEDTVLMLKNRLSTLHKAEREGTIVADDANVERNKINRALLDTLNILEDLDKHQKSTLTLVQSKKDEIPLETSTRPVTATHDNSKKTPIPTQWLMRGALALATILVTVLIERSINRWFDGNSASVKDLTVRLVFQPDHTGIRHAGEAKVLIGKCVAVQQPMSSNGTYHVTGIPEECWGDTVKVELPGFRFKYKVSGQSALNLKKSNDITFNIELATNTYSGKILHPNLKPAAGVEIDFENGLARAITDSGGKFGVTLPVFETDRIQLTMLRQGKPPFSRQVALNADVLNELKIPD